MKHTGWSYIVHADLEFTKEDIDHLLACAARHYDAKCRAAGQVGGLIYGLQNMLVLGENNVCTTTLSGHEIDTLAKITEMDHFHGSGSPLHSALASLLGGLMGEAMRVTKASSTAHLPLPIHLPKT